MSLYLDGSVIVKRDIDEAGSEETAVLQLEADAIGTNLISRAEVDAGIMRASRLGIITEDKALRALNKFRSEWEKYIRLPLDEASLFGAEDLVRTHDLRGYDAVHLSAAIMWQEAMGDPITMASFDKKRWQFSRVFGLAVWPEAF
jgi:predicted nucleic acid-binding protein